MLLYEIFNEKGITDIIYEYNCGIGYRNLEMIIYRHFSKFNPDIKVLNELTEYMSKVLSKGEFNNGSKKFEIKIFLKYISCLISGRKNLGRMMMYKHNHDHSLYDTIQKMMKDIEIKSNNSYDINLYGR